MKNPLSIVCCLIIFGCSKPSEENIKLVNATDSTLIYFSYSLFPVGGFHGYIKETSMYNSSLPILQHGGSFTTPNAKEVLISVPYVSVHGSFSKLFIAKTPENKEHELINWFTSDCSSYSIADIDNDGVDEITTEYLYTDQENVLHKTYEVFSLAGDTSRIIYRSHSRDSREAYNIHDRLPGDTISVWIDHTLVDMNKDSIFEIQEITKHIRIDSITSGTIRSSEMNDTIIFRFSR